MCLLAELNGLKLTGGDVGNAYLEAYTTEKVCVCAGPEFGPLEGHLLVIEKALYERYANSQPVANTTWEWSLFSH